MSAKRVTAFTLILKSVFILSETVEIILVIQTLHMESLNIIIAPFIHSSHTPHKNTIVPIP